MMKPAMVKATGWRRAAVQGRAMALAAAVAVLGLAGGAPSPAASPQLAPQRAALIADDVTLPPPPGQPPKIPSNFDRRTQLHTEPPPPTMAPDVVGAFRFACQPSHLSYDDPLAAPGRPGASHLHQFFGNTLTDAHSTYASLRSRGDSTCMGPLNRSAYWMPAMLNGAGQVVRPDVVGIYYKRRPQSDPFCRKQGRGCVDLPRGLRYVFGYDMGRGEAAPLHSAYWNCQGKGAQSGIYDSLAEARRHCAVGSQVGGIVIAPDCWDGVNLDATDHRSHLSFGSYGDWGYRKCPVSHPWVIPQFTLQAWYTTDASLPNWHLSSDRMAGMAALPDGASLHADWWGAWDDATLDTWQANCLNRLLSCNDAALGDGTALNRPPGFTFFATPRLVPVPPRPRP